MFNNISFAQKCEKRRLLSFLSIALALAAFCFQARAATQVTINFTSTYDGSAQRGYVRVPAGYDQNTPTAVLVWVQGMFTPASHGITYIGAKAEAQGWLLVLAEMHGLNSTSSQNRNLGAPHAQQDLIDVLNIVKQQYNVDTRRIYLAGISMGGLTGALTLENYPGIFAAGVLLMSITELDAWYTQTLSNAQISNAIVAECGGTPAQQPAEYARRQSLTNAHVLAGMPMLIEHGATDDLVPKSHTENLVAAIQQHNPQNLQVIYFNGGHEENKVDKDQFLNFLALYSLAVPVELSSFEVE